MEILGYDYVHWLVVASLMLLTGAPVIGVAVGYVMSKRRRRNADEAVTDGTN